MPWVRWLLQGRGWGRRREGNPQFKDTFAHCERQLRFPFLFHSHCDFLLDIQRLKATFWDLLEDSQKIHAFSRFSLVKLDIQTQ